MHILCSKCLGKIHSAVCVFDFVDNNIKNNVLNHSLKPNQIPYNIYKRVCFLGTIPIRARGLEELGAVNAKIY